MKTNKYLLKLTFLSLALLLTFAASAEAQRKKPTPTKKPTTTTTTTTTTNNLDIRQSAETVSNQIKNVSKFIYVLGSVASGFEIVDKEAKTGKLSRAVVDKNNQDKQTVITSIRNLKAGLAALEVEFRTKPALKNYLFKIQGITDLTTQSEDFAMAGRFTDSGKPLLLVIEKLADTLAAMP